MPSQTQEKDPPDDVGNDADAEAAFAASFDGKDSPPAKQPTEKKPGKDGGDGKGTAPAAAPAATPAPSTAPVAAPPAGKDGVPPAPPPAKTPPPSSEPPPSPPPAPATDTNAAILAEQRRIYGRMGQLADEIAKLRAAPPPPAPNAPPTAAPPAMKVELKRLAEEYPDLAPHLGEDLAELLAGFTPGKASDPKEIETLIKQRVDEGVAQFRAQMRDAAVDDAHPTWRNDLFTEDAVTKEKRPSADYVAWRTSIGEQEAQAFEGSQNPHFVIRKLTGFYEWKAKAAKDEADKQERLKAATQPQGASRGNPPSLSDDEAEQKGFEEGFNGIK